MHIADEDDPERAQEPGPLVTPALFAEWRAPRFGASNPERLTNPVWEWLIRSEQSAYSASQHFGLGGGECREPGWSFAALAGARRRSPMGARFRLPASTKTRTIAISTSTTMSFCVMSTAR
jgi:hypothetical protein